MAKGKYKKWLEKDGLLLLKAWARDGLTDEQMAHNMGVSRSTLADWKIKHSDISDALKRGKEIIDIEVENALFKRAVGYSYKEITQERKNIAETGKSEIVVTKIVTKEVVPDTTAQIIWLKNRKPNNWRDKIIDNEEERTIEDLTTLSEMLK